MKITLHKGGTEEKTVELESLQIPNLWHYRDDAKPSREEILRCWHITHDLRRALIEAAAEIKRLRLKTKKGKR